MGWCQPPTLTLAMAHILSTESTSIFAPTMGQALCWAPQTRWVLPPHPTSRPGHPSTVIWILPHIKPFSGSPLLWDQVPALQAGLSQPIVQLTVPESSMPLCPHCTRISQNVSRPYPYSALCHPASSWSLLGASSWSPAWLPFDARCVLYSSLQDFTALTCLFCEFIASKDDIWLTPWGHQRWHHGQIQWSPDLFYTPFSRPLSPDSRLTAAPSPSIAALPSSPPASWILVLPRWVLDPPFILSVLFLWSCSCRSVFWHSI